MKLIFDLLPVILFFLAYKIAAANQAGSLELVVGWFGQGIQLAQAPILIATAVTIVASVAQIGWVALRHRKVENMMWISLAMIVLLGGATLVFHDPDFIKWKPTALYWLFSAVLLVSASVFHRNLIRSMFEPQVRLPGVIWTRLNGMWLLFFFCMGALNLYVANHYSEDTWVNFKMFGSLGLMFLFVLAQGFYMARHIEEESTA